MKDKEHTGKVVEIQMIRSTRIVPRGINVMDAGEDCQSFTQCQELLLHIINLPEQEVIPEK